ncbi:MAG TPA: type II toxin-antitoxin system RelE/ParE family toxin [Bosea sp. (in: a-proteobacteria)]|uniref:type II toxin-antitoxin system RelE/ParE family toxin n=1 Tax=Bosea sp. (in: a-proteobacteria) TaxID=1871050 RepID=UPI002E153F79|nr:type II toxin-antitoxin system RelE/ParE family toxin [Bosea sp. (in: a-proteobacteria)]
MRLFWTVRALSEIDAIFAYVAADSPLAAERLAVLIEAKARSLIDQPNMGRSGRVDGTREFVVTGTPYILPYRVRDGRVEILAALHASRHWPDQF